MVDPHVARPENTRSCNKLHDQKKHDAAVTCTTSIINNKFLGAVGCVRLLAVGGRQYCPPYPLSTAHTATMELKKKWRFLENVRV